MPMLIKKADMLAAVAMLAKIPVQEGVPTSEMLKISSSEKGNLLLSATGGLNCVCRLPKQETKLEEIAVPRAPFCIFADISRSIDANLDFEISQDDAVLNVRQGKRLIRLPVKEPTGNYGCANSDKFSVFVEPEGLRKQIGSCVNFAVDTSDQADLYCVYLAPEGVLAADRKAGIRTSTKLAQEQFLPRKFAELFAEQEDGQLLVSNKLIRFKSSKYTFEQALPAEDYFPYKKFMNLQAVPANANTITFDAGLLQEAVLRYTSFISFASDDEKILTMRLTSGKAYVLLEMRISGSHIRESVKLSTKAVADVEHKFVASYIAKFCANVDVKETVSIATTDKSPLFWLKCGKTVFYLAKVKEAK
jgi:hypothetical protein